MRLIVAALAMMAATAHADTLRIETVAGTQVHAGVIVRYQQSGPLGRIDFGSTGYWVSPPGKTPPAPGNITVFVNGDTFHNCAVADIEYVAQHEATIEVSCP